MADPNIWSLGKPIPVLTEDQTDVYIEEYNNKLAQDMGVKPEQIDGVLFKALAACDSIEETDTDVSSNTDPDKE